MLPEWPGAPALWAAAFGRFGGLLGTGMARATRRAVGRGPALPAEDETPRVAGRARPR